MYRFLSSAFLKPPTPELLRQCASRELLDDLSDLFGREAVAELEDYAESADVEDDLPSMRQEYMDLFAVPSGRYLTPFEDVYRSRAGEGSALGPLLGACAIQVIRIYRQAGAAMEVSCKELPTHVGVELSFMSHLCKREAETARPSFEKDPPRGEERPVDQSELRLLQVVFLRHHLHEWFPLLNRQLQNRASSALYRGLGLLTEEFLSQDLEHLEAPGD